MPEQSPRTANRPSGSIAVPGLLAAGATLVAMWPYTGVVHPGEWTFIVVVVVVVTMLAALLGRTVLARARNGTRNLLTLIGQLVALTATCTALMASETAIAGLLPTPTSVQLVGVRVRRAVEEITNGVAPIDSTASMAVVLGLAFAVVAVLVDHLLANRVIMLTVLLTSIVGAVPMLLSYGSINIAWFLLQAVTILLILRFGARQDRQAPRQTPYAVATVGGAAAIAATLFVAPALPLASAAPGTGPMLTVDASLRLGDDLRRPEGVEALTLVTSAARPPYLRVATLSRFDGDVWRPDRSDRTPLREGFGARPWRDDIKAAEHQVSIRVTGVSSDRLPVPYAAEDVTGVGPGWQVMRVNRTVLSRTQNAAGADYTVRIATPEPTLEQIRAAEAAGAEFVGEPVDDLPPVIGELARDVTADAETDYDKLIALQDWFRSDFSYSLDAPVEEGFDGTGTEAVVRFLEERTGYCVHFAGAFALMAQSLDMPVRIVVGYLPGTATDQKVDDDIVYSVSSEKLHSWPEVYFTGIGWVPFEPTATLGEPTDFVSTTQGGGDGSGPDAPTPTDTSSPEPTAAPTLDPDDQEQGLGGGQDLETLNPMPVALVTLGIVLAVLMPALVRRARRMLRTAAARRGDAMAAWREVTDTLVDLGLPVSEAETARMRAQALVASREVPDAAMRRLVAGVERQSYSPARAERPGDDLSGALHEVLAGLTGSVDARRRMLALLLPVSLFAPHRVRAAVE